MFEVLLAKFFERRNGFLQLKLREREIVNLLVAHAQLAGERPNGTVNPVAPFIVVCAA